MTETRVLYCSLVSLVRDTGGGIVCREHLQRLAAVENCDLHVCSIGPSTLKSATRALVQRLGAEFHAIGLSPMEDPPQSRWLLGLRWPFTYETQALAQRQTDDEFSWLLEHIRPDIVVIDYLFTALFVPSLFLSNARIVTITLNREADFFSELRRYGRLDSHSSNSAIAVARLNRFEREVYERSDVVVALSPGDFPRATNGRATATCIEPALDNVVERWRPTQDSHLFFVGNIVHYPNYLAIQWLAEKFAPALKMAAPDLRLEIIGATADEVPRHWRHSNIEYLGLSTNEGVEKRLRGCRLFIAPIENNFGSKIKILQCLSFGTPMIASPGALSGVPFSDGLPKFSMSDAPAAARLAAELASDPKRLLDLSAEISRLNRDFHASRSQKWTELLTELKARALRPRSRFGFLAALSRSRPRVVDVSKPWPSQLEVGVQQPIGASTHGLYDLEFLEGQPLRWTEPKAAIRVPLNQQTLPKHMNIELYGIVPAGGMDVTLTANGTEIYRGVLGNAGLSTTLALPDVTQASDLEISIETQGFQPTGDSRRLGVALRSLMLCQNAGHPLSNVSDASRPWPPQLEVGVRQPIGASTYGLYDLEFLEGQPLRWSEPKAAVRVPLNRQTPPKRMKIELYGIVPAGGMDVTLTANGTEIYRGILGNAGLSTTLALPDVTQASELEISIDTQGFQPVGDSRRLGVAVRSLMLCQR